VSREKMGRERDGNCLELPSALPYKKNGTGEQIGEIGRLLGKWIRNIPVFTGSTRSLRR
jgi:hypothetical protein